MKVEKRKNKPIRIVVTGGHLDPAIAVIEELKKRGTARGGLELHWIGQSTSLRGEKTPSVEAMTIKRRGIPFYDLFTGKLYRTGPGDWLKIPLGFFHALYLLSRIRPGLVVSFGGYLAAPVVLAAFVLGIPSVTHEQTVVSGWANRFIALFAKRIFVSWPESLKYFPRRKTVLTGNPLRRAVFEKRTKRFHFRNDLPVIYVTGGKRGAHVINEAVREALSRFLEKYNLIHQTGSSEVFQDYQKLVLLRNQLPPRLRNRYLIRGYFGEKEIGSVFRAASAVVGRSGANIVTELAALGKPAVLIPIPWVSHQEQLKNAQMLARLGAALILPQDRLSSETLLEALEKLFQDYPRYREGAVKAKRLVDLSAATKIADEVVRLID